MAIPFLRLSLPWPWLALNELESQKPGTTTKVQPHDKPPSSSLSAWQTLTPERPVKDTLFRMRVDITPSVIHDTWK